MNDMHEISSDPSLVRNVYRLRGVIRDILSEMTDARKNAESIRSFARASVKVILEDFEAAADRAAATRPEFTPAADRCNRCRDEASVLMGAEPLCGRCYSHAMRRMASG